MLFFARCVFMPLPFKIYNIIEADSDVSRLQIFVDWKTQELRVVFNDDYDGSFLARRFNDCRGSSLDIRLNSEVEK